MLTTKANKTCTRNLLQESFTMHGIQLHSTQCKLEKNCMKKCGECIKDHVSIIKREKCLSEWVSEQFPNGTSAQCRLCSAILLKLERNYVLTIGWKTIAMEANES